MLDLERLNIDAGMSFEDANTLLYRLGITDGLPVVPPTGDRVAAMVGERDPSRTVTTLPPMQGQATVRGLAMCAVMAGCRSDDFNVLQAATAAVAAPEFNLFGIQTTTGTVTPMLIINGPVIQRLGLNTAANALGPGTRANAAIGRALQFVLRTIGGAEPGRGDRATMGQPGKFTFCCAENALASPWGALHVWRGFAAEQSTVTGVGATGTVEIVDTDSVNAEGVLTTMAHSMTIAGNLGRDYLLGSGEPLLLGPRARRDHCPDPHPPADAGLSVRARPVAGRGTGAGSGGAPAGNFGDGIDSRAMPGGHHAGGAGRVGSQIDLRADVGRRHTGCNSGH